MKNEIRSVLAVASLGDERRMSNERVPTKQPFYVVQVGGLLGQAGRSYCDDASRLPYNVSRPDQSDTWGTFKRRERVRQSPMMGTKGNVWDILVMWRTTLRHVVGRYVEFCVATIATTAPILLHRLLVV